MNCLLMIDLNHIESIMRMISPSLDGFLDSTLMSKTIAGLPVNEGGK